MKFYVIISAFSTLGWVQVSASVRELVPEGPAVERYTVSSSFEDDGTDDPQEYLRSALSGMLEAVYDDTPRPQAAWGVPGGML